ncbi:MAG: hypothetical protein AAF322_02535 [Pseudomonadota bacterium]
MPQPLVYGPSVALCVFVVGWATGMGGSLLPNLGFSALMGAFAAALFAFARRVVGRKGGD